MSSAFLHISCLLSHIYAKYPKTDPQMAFVQAILRRVMLAKDTYCRVRAAGFGDFHKYGMNFFAF
jgi:hypothetical protein